MTIDTRLAEIRARAEAATEGPWTALGSGVASGDHWHVIASGEAVAHISSRDGVNEDQREPDAEFIAHARTDLPALLAAVEAVRELHQPGHTFHGHGFSTPLCSCGAPLPCPTIQAVAAALDTGTTTREDHTHD